MSCLARSLARVGITSVCCNVSDATDYLVIYLIAKPTRSLARFLILSLGLARCWHRASTNTEELAQLKHFPIDEGGPVSCPHIGAICPSSPQCGHPVIVGCALDQFIKGRVRTLSRFAGVLSLYQRRGGWLRTESVCLDLP